MQEKIKNWWYTLAGREQKTLTIGAIIAIILIIYVAIWQPFNSALNAAKNDVQNKRDLVIWMQHATARIKAMRASGIQKHSIGSESLLTFIDSSLRSNNLHTFLAQLEQADKNQVKLQFNSVPFDNLIGWLTSIWQHFGITVVNATFQTTNKSGLTKTTLLLAK